jgi:hypothetical protein
MGACHSSFGPAAAVATHHTATTMQITNEKTKDLVEPRSANPSLSVTTSDAESNFSLSRKSTPTGAHDARFPLPVLEDTTEPFEDTTEQMSESDNHSRTGTATVEEAQSSPSVRRASFTRVKPGYSSGGSSGDTIDTEEHNFVDSYLNSWKSELSSDGDLSKSVVRIEVTLWFRSVYNYNMVLFRIECSQP